MKIDLIETNTMMALPHAIDGKHAFQKTV